MTNNTFIKNIHLPGEDFFWHGNKTGFLLIHGFTATTAEVRPFAQVLHEKGFTVSGPLLPGHGTHPEDLNKTTWKKWSQAVEHSYQELSKHCNRVFVIGESMGGVLALELATRYKSIAGLILFAPAIKVSHLWTARFIAPFKPYLAKPEKDDGLPWKGYTVHPLKGAAELRKLQIHVQKRLKDVTQPVLMFTGEYDRTISTDSASIIMDNVGTSKKRHIHLNDSGHCILLDQDPNNLMGFLLETFLGNQFPTS